MPQTAADYFAEHGHPPEAAGVLAVDFDGTLYPKLGLFDAPPPNPGAVEAMARLAYHGFSIIIWTSRLDEGWLEQTGQSKLDQVEYITRLLKRDAIPYNALSGSKPPAERYIDDRALPYRDNWKDIADFLIVGDSDGA